MTDGTTVTILNPFNVSVDVTAIGDLRYGRLSATNAYTTANGFATSVSASEFKGPLFNAGSVVVSGSMGVSATTSTTNLVTLKGIVPIVSIVSASPTVTIDFSTGSKFLVSAGVHKIVQFAEVSSYNGLGGLVYFVMEAANLSVTWPSNVKWVNGTTATFSVSAGAVDMFVYNIRSTAAIDGVYNTNLR